MLRRMLLVLTILVMPALAIAANMQVTSSALPSSGGSINPNGIKLFPGPAAASYTITVNPGWSISSVLIDNVNTGAPYGTSYSIPYVSGSLHTIKVTFTQASYSITTSAGVGGQIQVTGGGGTGIPAGSSRIVIVSPSSGYKIHSYIVDNGTPVVPADPTVAASIPFNNIQANHSVSATFDFMPIVTSSAGADQTIVAGSGGTASTTLTGTATTNNGPLTYLWNVVSKPAGTTATFGSAASATTTFNVSAIGAYTVALTATSGGTSVVSAPITITVLSFVQNAAIVCTTCHATDIEGIQWNGSPHGISLKTTAPACPNCHNPGVQLPHPGYSIHNTTSNPGLFYSCVTCHFPGSANVASWPPPGLSFHTAFDGTNQCVQCHDPHTTLFNGNLPYPHLSNYSTAQFVTTNISCNNCHVSAVDNSFHIYSANSQWAKSGHGNPVSPAYIGPGPYTEANLEAADYKFLGTPLPATAGTTASQDCVRCHTTTGFINYITPIDPQNPATAFSDIHAWGTPGDRKREMVACSACHNNSNGFDAEYSRRTVGILDSNSYTNVVQAWYNYSSAATKKIIRSKLYVDPAFNDFTDSNICITCHSGKATGNLIKQTTSNPAVCANASLFPSIVCRVGNGSVSAGLTSSFWANVDFIDPHGMASANLLIPDNNRAGYEFRPGSSTTTEHSNIGTDSSSGPCVECHMSAPQKHLFSPVSSASNGVITAITTTLCSNCHGGNEGAFIINSASDLETRKEGYQAALAVIAAQLASKAVYFNSAKAPYFFTTADPAQQSSLTRVKNWNSAAPLSQGAHLMGAAFNLRLLQSDAGWVHNGVTAKRLLYDTIDYLDDGLQNNTVLTAIQNASIDQSVKDKAVSYIGTRPNF